MSQARLLASAVSRSRAATAIDASGMRVGVAWAPVMSAAVLPAAVVVRASVALAGRAAAAIAAASRVGTRRMAFRVQGDGAELSKPRPRSDVRKVPRVPAAACASALQRIADLAQQQHVLG